MGSLNLKALLISIMLNLKQSIYERNFHSFSSEKVVLAWNKPSVSPASVQLLEKSWSMSYQHNLHLQPFRERKPSWPGRCFIEVAQTGHKGRACTPGNSQEGNPSHRKWQTKIGTLSRTHTHTHNFCCRNQAGGGIRSSGSTDVSLTWGFFLSDLWVFDFIGTEFAPDALSCTKRRWQMCWDVLHVYTSYVFNALRR